MNFFGCKEDEYCTSAGPKLKANSSLWNSNGNGTDDYGFSALPGGFGKPDGDFNSVGNGSYWWSASEAMSPLNNYFANSRVMGYYSKYDDWYYSEKSSLYSVRCVKN